MDLSDAQIEQTIIQCSDKISGCQINDNSSDLRIEVDFFEPFISCDQLYQVLPTEIQNHLKCVSFSKENNILSVTFENTYQTAKLEDFKSTDKPIINEFLKGNSITELKDSDYSWEDGCLIIYADWETLSTINDTINSPFGIPFAVVSIFSAPVTNEYNGAMKLRKLPTSKPMKECRFQEVNKKIDKFGPNCPNCSDTEIYLLPTMSRFSCLNCDSVFPQLTDVVSNIDGEESVTKLNEIFNNSFTHSIQNADNYFFNGIKLNQEIYSGKTISIYTVTDEECYLSTEGKIAIVIPDEYEDIVILYDPRNEEFLKTEEDVDKMINCEYCENKRNCGHFEGGRKNAWGVSQGSHFLCDKCSSRLKTSIEKSFQNKYVQKKLAVDYL